MQTWRAITEAELEALVERQLAECTPQQQRRFAETRVPFYRASIRRLGSVESVLVVARIGDSVIYFEDIEEGFELAAFGADGILPEPGNMQYKLAHVLRGVGL